MIAIRPRQLIKEVMAPREALCGACLAFDSQRRSSTFARVVWVFVLAVIFVRLLEALK